MWCRTFCRLSAYRRCRGARDRAAPGVDHIRPEHRAAAGRVLARGLVDRALTHSSPMARSNSRRNDLAQAVEEAVSLYRQGRLAEAEKICTRVLRARADWFDALHLLGLLKLQSGKAGAACSAPRAALSSIRRRAGDDQSRPHARGAQTRPRRWRFRQGAGARPISSKRSPIAATCCWSSTARRTRSRPSFARWRSSRTCRRGSTVAATRSRRSGEAERAHGI